jgi:hypothetical protein
VQRAIRSLRKCNTNDYRAKQQAVVPHTLRASNINGLADVHVVKVLRHLTLVVDL